MGDATALLGLITATLTLLKPNEKAQTRKSIRLAYKNYRKIKRIIKKKGITAEEQVILDNMLHQLIKAQSKLL